jgi:hypothetical protein
MERYINLGDTKGRNAEILFSGISKKPVIKVVTQAGEPVKTLRVLKAGAGCSYEALVKKFGNDVGVSEALITDDPDIDLVNTGRFIRSVQKVYVNGKNRPVYSINCTEQIFRADGTFKEERPKKELEGNILAEFPVRPVGKLLPRKELYNKFVFAKKYQLSHVNGLTFDFLMDLAKELSEKDSMMMLGAGAKGTDPLVFQDGGKSYRAFLEGRVKEDGYVLLMHLSNLELKGIL